MRARFVLPLKPGVIDRLSVLYYDTTYHKTKQENHKSKHTNTQKGK
jgi:hypothetical protein